MPEETECKYDLNEEYLFCILTTYYNIYKLDKMQMGLKYSSKYLKELFL
jgi:hypothetical protein